MVVFMLERLSDSVALIDTEALGERGVVAVYLVSGKENALIDMGYRSSAGIVIRDLEEWLKRATEVSTVGELFGGGR